MNGIISLYTECPIWGFRKWKYIRNRLNWTKVVVSLGDHFNNVFGFPKNNIFGKRKEALFAPYLKIF